jgi:hypothetical protein
MIRVLSLPWVFPAVSPAQPIGVNNGGSITITGYSASVRSFGPLVIPDKMGGLPVTSIGDWAFYNGASELNFIPTSVVLPDSVTNIGMYAFAWTPICHASLGTGLVTIGTGAFADCQLTATLIPSQVATIGPGALAYNWVTPSAYFFEGRPPTRMRLFLAGTTT